MFTCVHTTSFLEKKTVVTGVYSNLRFNSLFSGDPCSVQIAEDENGYVIANVKPKPEDDNGYVQANVHDQPNVIDERAGYVIIDINRDKMTEDKDGYLKPTTNQKKGIYVNETHYCTVDNTNVGSRGSNGKDIT